MITSAARDKNRNLLQAIAKEKYYMYSNSTIIVDGNEVSPCMLPASKLKLLTLRLCEKIESDDQDKIRQKISDLCATRLNKTTELFKYLSSKQKKIIHSQSSL